MFGFSEDGRPCGFTSDNGISWFYEPNNGHNAFWRWMQWCGTHQQQEWFVNHAMAVIRATGPGEAPYRVSMKFSPVLPPAQASFVRRFYESESTIGFAPPDDGSVELVLAEDIYDFDEAVAIADDAVLGNTVCWSFDMRADETYIY